MQVEIRIFIKIPLSGNSYLCLTLYETIIIDLDAYPSPYFGFIRPGSALAGRRSLHAPRACGSSRRSVVRAAAGKIPGVHIGGGVERAVSRYLFVTKLLCQSDEKSFRSADVAQPIRILVLDHIADKLRAVLAEPDEHLVDVFDGEHGA